MLVNGDAEVTRYLPYNTWQALPDAEAWLERMNKLTADGSASQLVIHHNGEGQAVGTVLLFRHEAASSRIELGYVLARRYWRQGMAREALALALNRSFGELGLRRVEAEVNIANTASNALLSSLGFAREGTMRERWSAKGATYSVHFYGLLASEWLRSPNAA
jgi:RimJ/RimL family protein N-acetyltransferase